MEGEEQQNTSFMTTKCQKLCFFFFADIANHGGK